MGTVEGREGSLKQQFRRSGDIFSKLKNDKYVSIYKPVKSIYNDSLL